MESSTATCAYRGKEGKKCAIGALIKDEFYNPEFEGHAFGNHTTVQAVERSLGTEITVGDESFLRRLQRLHDGVSPSQWEQHLKEFATKNNLTY